MKNYVISVPGILALFGITVLALLILVISAGEQEKTHDKIEYCDSDIPSGMSKSVYEKIIKERPDIGRILVDNYLPNRRECFYDNYSVNEGLVYYDGDLMGNFMIYYLNGDRINGELSIYLDKGIVEYTRENCNISWTETIV